MYCNQWRIQNFPDVVPTYYLTIFPQKLHENERNWGVRLWHTPWYPPMVISIEFSPSNVMISCKRARERQNTRMLVGLKKYLNGLFERSKLQ